MISTTPQREETLKAFEAMEREQRAEYLDHLRRCAEAATKAAARVANSEIPSLRHRVAEGYAVVEIAALDALKKAGRKT